MPEPAASPPALSTTYRWVRTSQYGLNVAIVLAGVALTAGEWHRALFALALVPLVFVPFSYARLRAQRTIEGLLGGRPYGRRAATLWSGVAAALDAVMLAQLLTARSQLGVSVLQAPGITWVGPVWFSGNALFLLGLGLLGLVRGARRGLHGALRALRVSVPPPQAPPDPGRRLFLKQLGFLGVGTPFVVSLTGVQLSYAFRVQEHEIVLPHWPRALDGLRVAHLSDIHVGGAMNRARLLHVAELTLAARPDLVLHTGDFLTHRSGDFDAPLYEALARIRAPYGQWASLGNHDFDDPARLVRQLADAGVTTLRDRLVGVPVGGLQLELAGVDFQFGRGGRDGRYASIAGAWPRRGAPRLLLNHDPSAFGALPEDCADLVCSGHTHGGHIGIQLGPDHAVTVIGLVGLPDQGLFTRRDLRLFVTRCVGFYGYPMRLGIPPEISLLVLRAA
jgi:predicted MPP superfamily phosphohydrolase